MQAVFGQGGAALRVAHLGLGVGPCSAVVVGDHEGVAAESIAGQIALVLPPVEEALFEQQALHEGEVGFLVLDAERSLCIHRRIGQFPAPARHELALAGMVGEDFVDDLRHGSRLEHEGVAPVAEERQPGLDRQAVAGQAAVAAAQHRLRDVAVERAQCAAA